MKRTFKNFDEYSEYYENREHKMNDVDVVENTVTVCADGEFECKNWKTAVRRFFKEINDNSLFDGWKECITECVENGIWKEKEEYNGEHVCGGWFWEVECIDEGRWYVSLTVSKEIEEESESAETVEETIVTVNQTEVITMMYITSKVTGEKKATITMATEKRLQELMNREHQSNEAKFLAWALEEYKCECGCGGASIKEIRKYAEQEDWLRDEFGFDTEGYMEDTARAMNNRFHDYMAYWCRFCHSSLSIKSFNKLVKAVYDMTDEYGYVIYPEEVEEEPEATAETVESVEETTVSETETVEETAEQETEINAEVAEVEAEQTAENKAETTAENITVSGTNQDNINVLIVADVINAFEMITHTGYFDTS